MPLGRNRAFTGRSPGCARIGTLGAKFARVEAAAAVHRADFERERERCERLMAECLPGTDRWRTRGLPSAAEIAPLGGLTDCTTWSRDHRHHSDSSGNHLMRSEPNLDVFSERPLIRDGNCLIPGTHGSADISEG
jgi:hypothetical protein